MKSSDSTKAARSPQWTFIAEQFLWLPEHRTHLDDGAIYIPRKFIRQNPEIIPLFNVGVVWVLSYWSPYCIRAFLKPLFKEYLEMLAETAETQEERQRLADVSVRFCLSTIRTKTDRRYWDLSESLLSKFSAEAEDGLSIRHHEASLEIWVAAALAKAERGAAASLNNSNSRNFPQTSPPQSSFNAIRR